MPPDMFHPLSLYVGLRYARARAHRFFVSFITWVSLVGVAVGVAALIVILSVMNGFETELRSRLLSLSAPVRIEQVPDSTPANASTDWARIATLAGAVPGVQSVARQGELQVLAVHQPEMLAVSLRAVESVGVEQLRKLVVDGDPRDLLGDDTVILGRLVADQLGVATGDDVTLLVPIVSEADLPEVRVREFHVVGMFEAGIQDHDATLAFTRLDTLLGLGAARSGNTGLSIGVGNALAAPGVAHDVSTALDAAGVSGVRVRDWTQDHASYFRAIRIEKTMMALILLLVVGVAAFNIVAMLVMVVSDKRTDIAILRTLGASPGTVARVFITQGLIVGWVGVLAGVALGVLLARNVDPILGFLNRTLGLQLFDADVFYITRVPSELHLSDVTLISVCALLLTMLATVYPSLRAAAVSPAEALRYE
jgi:lipoprotein-releasing system permease protein